jgi:hypothetical protein
MDARGWGSRKKTHTRTHTHAHKHTHTKDMYTYIAHTHRVCDSDRQVWLKRAHYYTASEP